MIKLKKWEELQFSDDFMFKKVMMNKDICRRVLESIMEIEIADIKYIEKEKTIDVGYDAKSIRLDVYVKDEKNTVYNIEMQNADRGNIPKRTRYYQGMIDLDLLNKGEDYELLNKSIIIFVCTFDLFNKDYCKYTFVPKCLEVEDCILDDETTRIILNTNGTKGNPPEDMKEFMAAVNGVFTYGELADIIKEEVENVKINEKARREYMTLYLYEKELQKDAKEDGMRQGIELGLQQGLQQGLSQGMEKGLSQGMEKGLSQGIEKGIQALILDNLEEGASKERIINKIETRFEISEEQAVEYFERYSEKLV